MSNPNFKTWASFKLIYKLILILFGLKSPKKYDFLKLFKASTEFTDKMTKYGFFEFKIKVCFMSDLLLLDWGSIIEHDYTIYNEGSAWSDTSV